ncbi:MAG: NAD+ synthase [Chlamydiia bacterium]|nr:NAD+ synthase [Chlamydiia bacterium]
MLLYLAQLNPIVGDIAGNGEKILHHIRKAEEQGAEIVLFPELALTGYPPQDLLLLPQFMADVELFLERIAAEVKSAAVVLGLPRVNPHGKEKPLYNSAAILQRGKVIGFQDKMLLPTYDVFDERRYFEPHIKPRLWKIAGKQVAITICEDIWYTSELSAHYRPLKPELLLNLSASPFSVEKPNTRLRVCQNASEGVGCPVVLCNQAGGNDSLLFDGRSVHVSGQEVLHLAPGFCETGLLWDLDVKESVAPKFDWVEDLRAALVMGIKDYFSKLGLKKALLGLSGGIDSAVVAALAVEALGAENVKALLLPSRYSSEGSILDAEELARNLKIAHEVISIEPVFESYLAQLEPYFEGRPFDVTEENLQARIRGAILMAFSNKFGALVLSTGNKSEMAMGYSTLYGDMVGGLGVLSDVTKRQVYALARSYPEIPEAILTKPPSAELKENQKDSDSLPDYDIIDNVLEDYIISHQSAEQIAAKHGYAQKLVEELIRRIHQNEYKRRQSAPGLRVSEKAFSIGRRFPIVQKYSER